MSVRFGLLALLDRGPSYGYELRALFEEATGGTWPLNIGQMYTTLARLQKEGLVAETEESRGGTNEDDRRRSWVITDQGRETLRAWFDEAVPRSTPQRDELSIKLTLASSTPGVDARSVIRHQRVETLRALQALTRKKTAQRDAPLAQVLLIDSLIFQAEAELRWLDHCEQLLIEQRKNTP